MKNFLPLNGKEQRLLFRYGALEAGIAKTETMEAHPNPVPADLAKYFEGVGKGQYFSITKREQINKSPEAKKGVKALQLVLKDSGLFAEAETALKADPKSDFRTKLEEAHSQIGQSLFSKSLSVFDAKKSLSQEADGDYGHSTRLAVAYLQWKLGANVDGAFGKQSLSLLNVDDLSKKVEAATDDVTRDELTKLKEAVEKNADDITEQEKTSSRSVTPSLDPNVPV